jgi:hypothetical protein
VALPTSLFHQRGEWDQGLFLDLPSPANCHEITADRGVRHRLLPSKTLETWRSRNIRCSVLIGAFETEKMLESYPIQSELLVVAF